MSKRKLPQSMAFYHNDGFVPAWKQASRFIGKDGRIATLPDIIDARLATNPGAEPWEMYFTSLSAEYFGVSQSGKRIIIVVHGIGPMSTLDGVLKAYSWEFKDKSRDRRGGRIAREEFLKLESGEYGEVQIVDFDAYLRRYQYPLHGQLRFSQAATDPLLRARFGTRVHEYLGRHLEEARKWHAEQAGFDPENTYKLQGHAEFCDRRRAMHARLSRPDSDPYIVSVEGAANCSYEFRPIEQGYAMAHLLSIGRLSHVHHSQEGQEFAQYESLAFDVSCHEWWNGTRLLGTRSRSRVVGTHSGVRMVSDIVKTHWRELMQPVTSEVAVSFGPLVQIGKEWFTQYPKGGPGLDTFEPEFRVTAIKPIGDVVDFTTPTLGYYGFFKYDLRDVRRVAPVEANAYALAGEPKIVEGAQNAERQHCPIQFYHVEVDTTQRLRRAKDLENDYDTLMELLTK